MKIGWAGKAGTVEQSILTFYGVKTYPPVVKHGWLENEPLSSDFPIQIPIFRGFSIAMFNDTREIPSGHLTVRS